jgi:hypothetical protein
VQPVRSRRDLLAKRLDRHNFIRDTHEPKMGTAGAAYGALPKRRNERPVQESNPHLRRMSRLLEAPGHSFQNYPSDGFFAGSRASLVYIRASKFPLFSRSEKRC